MIGSFHYDENVKIEQMSKAMSGLAFGVLIGPFLGLRTFWRLRVTTEHYLNSMKAFQLIDCKLYEPDCGLRFVDCTYTWNFSHWYVDP